MLIPAIIAVDDIISLMAVFFMLSFLNIPNFLTKSKTPITAIIIVDRLDAKATPFIPMNGTNNRFNTTNGLTIKTLCKLSTVEKHIRDGHIVSKCFEERLHMAEVEESYKTLIPATKADINLLLNEIRKQFDRFTF